MPRFINQKKKRQSIKEQGKKRYERCVYNGYNELLRGNDPDTLHRWLNFDLTFIKNGIFNRISVFLPKTKKNGEWLAKKTLKWDKELKICQKTLDTLARSLGKKRKKTLSRKPLKWLERNENIIYLARL